MEEIKLCQVFGIQNFFNCVNIVLDKPLRYFLEHEPVLVNYSIADLAFHLVHEFHGGPQNVTPLALIPANTFMHRLTFLSALNETSVWNKAMHWFDMGNFKLGHWMDRWEEFNQ